MDLPGLLAFFFLLVAKIVVLVGRVVFEVFLLEGLVIFILFIVEIGLSTHQGIAPQFH